MCKKGFTVERFRCLVFLLMVSLMIGVAGMSPASVAASSDQLNALMEDIATAQELTSMLMEIQELLLEQLALMQSEIEHLRANQFYSPTPATPSPNAVNVNSLEIVLGSLDVVGRAAWQTDMSSPGAAFFPRQLAAPTALEAQITFLSGNFEVQLGLLDLASETVVMAGTGHSRHAYFVGAGDIRDPGRSWMERSGQDFAVFERDRTYNLRVELLPSGPAMEVALYIDGQLVQSASGPSIQSGYPLLRTYSSQVRIDNFQVITF